MLKSLEEYKKEFADLIARDSYAGYNTYFGIICYDSEEPFYFYDVCYRFIGAFTTPQRAEAIMSRFKKGALNREQEKQFLEYMINESPYAETFIDHDVEEILNTRVVTSRVDVPSPLMQGALVHLRQCWEYPVTIHNWLYLVDAGFEKNLAFCLAHFIYPNSTTTFNLGGIESGHRCWSKETITYSHICNYLKGEYNNKLNSYNVYPSFRGNHTIFYNRMDERAASAHGMFDAWVREVLTSKNVKTYSSPFDKAVQQANAKQQYNFPLGQLKELAKYQQDFVDMCQEKLPKEKVA